MTTRFLNLVAYVLDCQDGSHSITIYNNREELAQQLQDDGADITVEEIESCDDPYENGTLSDITAELDENDQLVAPIHFSTDG
jgi:hypothetical protein